MQSQRTKVWLDCDPGLDDAFAIILAAHHSAIDLIGLSTSAGNTTLQNTTTNALNILFNIGRGDVTVVRGSQILVAGQASYAGHIHGNDGLGGVKLPISDKQAIVQNNFQTIRDMLMKQQQKIVWANTGSLTNLCFLFRKFPQVKGKIQRIVIMGGAIGRGNRTPAAQFNIFFDPEAANQVLKEKGDIPFIMLPLQLTHEVQARQNILSFLQSYIEVPLAAAILNMLKAYQKVYKIVHDFDFPPIHDPCVINYIINPKCFDLKKSIIVVDTYSISYGRTNCHFSDPLNPTVELKTIDFVGTRMRQRKVFWGYFREIFQRIFGQQKQIMMKANTQKQVKKELEGHLQNEKQQNKQEKK